MLENMLEQYGDGGVLMMAGAIVGVLFGAAAQHSRFCLRAATVEVAEGRFSQRLSIWAVAFLAAVFCVQGAIALGYLDVSEARQLATTGSMSGAIIGGAMFGVGMILARGCASRLLVLSATGNLRAILTGLVLTLVAQASLRGILSPARENLSQLWMVEGGDARNMLVGLGMTSTHAAVLGGFGLVAAVIFAARSGQQATRIIASAGVGAAVALGWLLTYMIAQTSFEVVPVTSVTFTGPSTDTLMGLVNSTDLPLGFGVGLVPGVFFGSGVMALLTREWKIERFEANTPMERYLVGATLMGFGSMLAGGCAVGAGMSGGAIFAVTAWVAIFSMWISAMLTHRVMLTRQQAVMA